MTTRRLLTIALLLCVLVCGAAEAVSWSGLDEADRDKISSSIATNCHGDVRWMIVQCRADAPHRWMDLSDMGLRPIVNELNYCRLTRLWRLYSFHNKDGLDDEADWCFAYDSAYGRTGRILRLGGERVSYGHSLCPDNYVVLAFVRRQNEPIAEYVKRGRPFPRHLTPRQKFYEEMQSLPSNEFLSKHGLKDFFASHVYRPVAGGVFRLNSVPEPNVEKLDEPEETAKMLADNEEKNRQYDHYVTISTREMSEVVYLSQKGDAAERLKTYNGFRKDCPLLEDMSGGEIKTDLGKDLEKAFERWRGKAKNGTIERQEKSR